MEKMESKIFRETSTEKQYILSCLLFLPVLIYYNKWCFNSVLAIQLSTAPSLILAKKKNKQTTKKTNKEKTNKTKGAIRCNVRSSSVSHHDRGEIIFTSLIFEFCPQNEHSQKICWDWCKQTRKTYFNQSERREVLSLPIRIRFTLPE